MTPLLSIITPTNNVARLRALYSSLLEQTVTNWEWVLVANGEVTISTLRECFDGLLATDKRIVFSESPHVGIIGSLKRSACELAKGQILVEVDHDDLLMPTALQRIKEAFDSDDLIGMVYSNRAAVRDDRTPYYFGEGYGWVYQPMNGSDLIETVMPSPHPAHFSRIWYAPDHVRAWRASAYWNLGGHDATLAVADDHDLCCRFYIGSKVHHINECLYVYLVHGENNWLRNADAIQSAQWRNFDKYIFPLYWKWCADNGLAEVVLQRGELEALLRHDSDRVGLLQPHALTAFCDPILFMNEAWRVLAHGGLLAIMVPSTDGRAAFQDPTHKSFWNENSFFYWTRAEFQKYISDSARGRFQVLRLRTYFPSDWHRENNMAFVQAYLVAIKDYGTRLHGELLI